MEGEIQPDRPEVATERSEIGMLKQEIKAFENRLKSVVEGFFELNHKVFTDGIKYSETEDTENQEAKNVLHEIRLSIAGLDVYRMELQRVLTEFQGLLDN